MWRCNPWLSRFSCIIKSEVKRRQGVFMMRILKVFQFRYRNNCRFLKPCQCGRLAYPSESGSPVITWRKVICLKKCITFAIHVLQTRELYRQSLMCDRHTIVLKRGVISNGDRMCMILLSDNLLTLHYHRRYYTHTVHSNHDGLIGIDVKTIWLCSDEEVCIWYGYKMWMSPVIKSTCSISGGGICKKYRNTQILEFF